MKTTFARTCEQCSQEFTVDHDGKRQRFCSRKCFGVFNRGTNHVQRKGVVTSKSCSQCGNVFTVASWNKDKKYCSVECYAAFRRTLVGEKAFNYGHKWDEKKKKDHSEAMKARGRLGPLAGNWKGGRIIDSGGYIFLKKVYLSPEDQALFPGLETYVMEHRLFVARKLGRPLKRREHVHHINGVKDDNRDENLMLMDHSKHSSKHANVWKTIQRLTEENRRLKALLENGNDFSMEVAS